MSKITSITKDENYEIVITSKSGHQVISDEPEEVGGMNKGMSPDDLIVAALASCTSATVKMYAQRKEWDLKTVQTTITLHRDKPTDLPTIRREVKLEGDLTAEQRERIMTIANKCPVHKLLSNPLDIESTLVD